MDTPAKLDFVRSYLRALCEGDLETVKSFFDEKSTFEDPYGTRHLVGVDKIGAFYEKVFVQGVSAEQTGQASCCGDSVVVPYRAKVGALQINTITVFQFGDSGKLKSMRAYWGPENMTAAE
jgi:steroid delta-isomerase